MFVVPYVISDEVVSNYQNDNNKGGRKITWKEGKIVNSNRGNKIGVLLCDSRFYVTHYFSEQKINVKENNISFFPGWITTKETASPPQILLKNNISI